MTEPAPAPEPTDLASYDVTIGGYPTTMQLSYQQAQEQGLYSGPIALPWKYRFAILEFTVHQLEAFMTEALAGQAKLDADVAALNEGVGNVVTEIAALKAGAPADLDFSGLDAAVSALQGATDTVESTEVAAEVPPVEEPVTP